MARNFLFCEETDTKLYSNDIVTISSYPNVKFIIKNGWYNFGGANQRGWYFLSLTDKSIIPVDQIDLTEVAKDSNPISAETHKEVDNSAITPTEPDHIEIPDSDTILKKNDVVTLSDYPNTNWVVKYGWYRIGTAQKQGWYFIDVSSRMVLPLEDVSLDHIHKEVQTGSSEFRPTLQDMDAAPAKVEFIVIPDTDIRLYDSDIVKLSNRPQIKWVVHLGWYIYQEVQNFGWYFVSIKNGEILPVSAVDLQLCTLETVKTQGSELYDGKVVNYTRPFTKSDAEVLNRTFITVDTIEQRDNLDKHKLVNGRIVRVNDAGGLVVYYAWNSTTRVWDKVDFGGGGSGSGIPEIIGTEDNPIILSEIPEGLYRVLGYYKICPADQDPIYTDIHHLAFVNDEGETVLIKVITETDIRDYSVVRGIITFSNIYATERYVDDKITVLEQQISEIISELMRDLPGIIDDRIAETMIPIPESFIRGLFA